MTDVVIVSAARTAVGKFGGSLAKIAAPDLGAIVIRALLERANLKPEQISEVILGQVLAAGSGQNPARQSLIKAGLPSSVPGMTINKATVNVNGSHVSGLNSEGVIAISAANREITHEDRLRVAAEGCPVGAITLSRDGVAVVLGEGKA